MSITAVGSGAWGQAEATGRMHLANRVARSMVAEQDVNQDGSLSLSETELSQASYSAIDGDGDGLLSSQELVSGLKDRKESLRNTLLSGVEGQSYPSQTETSPLSGHLEALASSVAAGLDVDKNGSIGLEESGMTSEGFGKVDGNGDGVLTAAEIASAIRDKRDEAGMFMQGQAGSAETLPQSGEAQASSVAARLDADGNGSISLAESGLTSEGFGKVDGDGDGVLTAPEIANAIRDKRDEAGVFLQGQTETTAASTETASVSAETGTDSEVAASTSTGTTTASVETAANPPLHRRMQQALDAYKGRMGELMSGLFEQPSAALADSSASTASAALQANEPVSMTV